MAEGLKAVAVPLPDPSLCACVTGAPGHTAHPTSRAWTAISRQSPSAI